MARKIQKLRSRNNGRIKALAETPLADLDPFRSFTLETLEEVAAVLGARDPLGDRSEPRVTAAATRKAMATRRKAARETRREKRDAAVERLKGTWRGTDQRTWYLGQMYRVLAFCPADGSFRSKDVKTGIMAHWIRKGCVERLEREMLESRLVPGHMVPSGKVTYQLTDKGRAARSLIWHGAALVMMGRRAPQFGSEAASLEAWLGGYPEAATRRPTREFHGFRFGDVDEVPWPDFGRFWLDDGERLET